MVGKMAGQIIGIDVQAWAGLKGEASGAGGG
jgi:hypothetical protein